MLFSTNNSFVANTMSDSPVQNAVGRLKQHSVVGHERRTRIHGIVVYCLLPVPVGHNYADLEREKSCWRL